MTTQKQISYMLLTVLIAASCCGAALAQTQAQAKAKSQYHVSNLDTLGGTSSGGSSINDQSRVAGYSRLPDNQNRQAALRRNGSIPSMCPSSGPHRSVTSTA